MKNQNLIFKIMTLAIVAMGAIALIHSCQKNSLPPTQEKTVQTTPKQIFGKAGGTACVCDPNYTNLNCPDPCVRQILMGVKQLQIIL